MKTRCRCRSSKYFSRTPRTRGLQRGLERGPESGERGRHIAQGELLSLPRTSCVTMENMLKCSVPHFLFCKIGTDAYLMDLFRVLHELLYLAYHTSGATVMLLLALFP